MKEIEIGRRVCVVGYGTSATLHSHRYVVVRLTKTLIVASYEEVSGRTITRRFRRSDGAEVPRHDWGGTRVHPYCAKKDTP